MFAKIAAVAASALAIVPSCAAAAASSPASLFTSPDPQLNRNKQVVHGIFRDLIQCGQWEKADRYLTADYIQHNPLVGSGRDTVVRLFRDEAKFPRREKCETLEIPVTAVIAEGDFVTVLMPVRYAVPGKPGETYATTWFDTWRIVDGKAAEHWDGQKLCPGLSPVQCMLASFEEAK
jgi:predicted SnoaL-like aldol condensation-catalyzing enzyme